MGLETVALAAVAGAGIFSAVSSAKSGQATAKSLTYQGEHNAQIYEQQAGMILEKKKLQDYQYNRASARMRASQVARTAGAGFNLSGSPLAMMIDSETQMLLDKATADYNLDVERNYALSGANYQRETAYQQSSLAKSTGYSNAFTTILNTGVAVGTMGLLSRSPTPKAQKA